MLYIMVLAALVVADGDVSCTTACARCDSRSFSELATVYCALCRECRDRRREWLVTVAPFRRNEPLRSHNMAIRRMAPVQPDYYTENYRRDAWSEHFPPRRHFPVCPPPPPCNDGGELGYIKVYGLKRNPCPPAPPCVWPHYTPYYTQTYTHTSPSSRQTQPSTYHTSTIQPMYQSNQCCPIFMPMMSCVCPLGVFGPGVGVFGHGGPFDPSLGANGHNQSVSHSSISTTESTTHTEPVYLYIGIPKEMKSSVDIQR